MAVNTTNIKYNVMVTSSSAYPWRHYIYTKVGTTYTSRSGSTAWDYFSNSPSNDDAILFGISMAEGASVVVQKWRDITFQVGTALNGGTLVWEYYNYAGSWASLTVTNGDAIKTTGTQTVTFTPPHDWYYTSGTGWSKAMYVRCRMSDTTGVTEGGANATTAIKMGTNAIHIHGNAAGSAVTLEDVYDTAVNQSWDVDPKQIMSAQKGNEGYYFDANIMIGSQSESLTGFLDLRGNTLVLENDCMLVSGSNSNKLNAGTLCQGYYASVRPTILTNQHSNNQWFTILGSPTIYGLSWINYLNGGVPAVANRANENTISSLGSGASAAANTTVQDSHFFGFQRTEIKVNTSSGTIKNLTVGEGTRMGDLQASSLDNIRILNSYEGFYTEGFPANVNVDNLEIVGNTTYKFRHYALAYTFRARNPKNLTSLASGDVAWGTVPTGDGSTNGQYIQYSWDIKVIDELGNPISGATVTLVPTGSNGYENNFSVTTAADGTITTQYATKWRAVYLSGTTSTISTYSPYTLRVYKAGVGRGEIRNITPTDKINWTVCLKKNSLNLAPELIQV